MDTDPMPNVVRLTLLAILFVGCSGPVDAVDAGATNEDAGPDHDAGPDYDAGPPRDAGPDYDAGPPRDAGPDYDAGPDAGPRVSNRYLTLAEEYAATIIAHGRDDRDTYMTATWGEVSNPVRTPLFVEWLSVETPHMPFNHRSLAGGIALGYPEEMVTASAMQNVLLATFFMELHRLTGDPSYDTVSRDVLDYVLSTGEINTSTGTFTGGFMVPVSRAGWFGNHAGLDLISDKIMGVGTPTEGIDLERPVGPTNPARPIIEIKHNFIPSGIMAQANPDAMRDFTERFIHASYAPDWVGLVHTRHPHATSRYRPGVWNNVDRIDRDQAVPVPNPDILSSSAFAGMPLMQLAASYYRIYDEERAWTLARQILERFDRSRHPVTQYYPLSYLEDARNNWNHEVGSFSLVFGVPQFLKLAMLFDRPEDLDKRNYLINFALRDLRAARTRFTPGVRGYAIDPDVNRVDADREYEGGVPSVFYSYALAHRLAPEATDQELMWEILRELFQSWELGDIGTSSGDEINLVTTGSWRPIPNLGDEWDAGHRQNNDNAFVVHALLELYRQKGNREYLESASFVMDQLIERFWTNGLFASVENGAYARLSNLTIIALLDLAAAMEGRSLDPNTISKTEFFSRYKYVDVGTWSGATQVNDNTIIGRLTR